MCVSKTWHGHPYEVHSLQQGSVMIVPIVTVSLRESLNYLSGKSLDQKCSCAFLIRNAYSCQGDVFL